MLDHARGRRRRERRAEVASRSDGRPGDVRGEEPTERRLLEALLQILALRLLEVRHVGLQGPVERLHRRQPPGGSHAEVGKEPGILGQRLALAGRVRMQRAIRLAGDVLALWREVSHRAVQHADQQRGQPIHAPRHRLGQRVVRLTDIAALVALALRSLRRHQQAPPAGEGLHDGVLPSEDLVPTVGYQDDVAGRQRHVGARREGAEHARSLLLEGRFGGSCCRTRVHLRPHVEGLGRRLVHRWG
ncbi:hypothetical protein [Sorangium sp. So ce1151]|uniref:hypothetical protein n=1 Tax=Sorangium sp. So ce1151 TaxID=3133332 RepID=UPI003F61B74D